jgi:hypothetical protein
MHRHMHAMVQKYGTVKLNRKQKHFKHLGTLYYRVVDPD